MTKEAIYTSLDLMLENPKAKTFLNHLVRGYMPFTDFKCVLSKDILVAAQDILAEVDTKDKNEFVREMDKIFDDKAVKNASLILVIK